jgi:hypothetical protein
MTASSRMVIYPVRNGDAAAFTRRLLKRPALQVSEKAAEKLAEK